MKAFVVTADLLECVNTHRCVMTVIGPVSLGSFSMFCSTVTELGILSQSCRLLEHAYPLGCHCHDDRISTGFLHFAKEYGAIIVRIMTMSIDPNKVVITTAKLCYGEI